MSEQEDVTGRDTYILGIRRRIRQAADGTRENVNAPRPLPDGSR
jgi:hypothetical protein